MAEAGNCRSPANRCRNRKPDVRSVLERSGFHSIATFKFGQVQINRMIQVISLILLTTAASEDWDQSEENALQYQGQQQNQDEYTLQDRETGEILNIRPNAYGWGVSADQYGRAIKTDPSLRVSSDAYSPGIGMDQYGRLVR